MITSFVSLINKFVTSVFIFFEKIRINYDEHRLYEDKQSRKAAVENERDKELVANDEKPKSKIIILKKGEPMETNINLTDTQQSSTPFESALESALMFGENMYFSAMAMTTSQSLSDPAKAPPNLTPEAYAAFCEYTAELFAVAAAARQELNNISA